MLKKIVTIIGLIGMSYIGIQAGEVIKFQPDKRIFKKSVSDSCLNNCLNNEAKKQVYIKTFLEIRTFLETVQPSKIIKGPKERGSIGAVSPNVCVYEAYYSDYGFTITSNKKDIKDVNDITLYRCFVSKKDQDVQELPLEVSKFVYERLQQKYEEKSKLETEIFAAKRNKMFSN